MEELTTQHFRKLLKTSVDELQKLCADWEKFSSDPDMPENVHDEVLSITGLTKLLLAQKLAQFRGLIDDSENKRGEKEITCVDLQGFWDMVYNEVEKVNKKFQRLDDCKNNFWVFKEEASKKIPIKKATLGNSVKTIVSAKSHSVAARKRLAEAKLKMKAQLKEQNAFVQETNEEEKQVLKTIKGTSIGGKVELQNPMQHIDSEQVPSSKISIKKKSSKKNGIAKVVKDKVQNEKKCRTEKENLTPVKKEEENLAKGKKASVQQTPSSKKRTRPFIPLQCVTRSKARKELIAKENLNA